MPVSSAPLATWTAFFVLIRLNSTIGLAACPGSGPCISGATVLAVPCHGVWLFGLPPRRRQEGLFQAETQAASRPASPISTRAQPPVLPINAAAHPRLAPTSQPSAIDSCPTSKHDTSVSTISRQIAMLIPSGLCNPRLCVSTHLQSRRWPCYVSARLHWSQSSLQPVPARLIISNHVCLRPDSKAGASVGSNMDKYAACTAAYLSTHTHLLVLWT